jgi:hypothetical protein
MLVVLVLLGSFGPFDLRGLLLMHTNSGGQKPTLFNLTPHRLVHFALFGLLSMLLSLTGKRAYQRLLALGSVIGFGLLVEMAEFLFSTNPFEFGDLRDDAWAACAGYALAEAYLFSASTWRKRSPRFENLVGSAASQSVNRF